MKAQSPERYLVHLALISAEVFFGLGGVVGALSLPATHPLKFALHRELWAGLVLLGISAYFQGKKDARSKDDAKPPLTTTSSNTTQWRRFVLLGFILFGIQSGFIVGLKMAGPLTASVWMPTKPIFTAAISMTLGWEPVRQKRIVGIGLAFVGCVAMVAAKKTKVDNSGNLQDVSADINLYLVGIMFLFCNVVCAPLYVTLSKSVLKLYPAVTITAWAYTFAVPFMLVANLIASIWPGLDELLCPECPTNDGLLHVPSGAIPALLYYIFFASVGAYGLLTWANQHATSTLVMGYTVLQPVTSAFLITCLLLFGWVPECTKLSADAKDHACLDYPTAGTLWGMIGVFGGLAMIISTEPKQRQAEDTAQVETMPFRDSQNSLEVTDYNSLSS